MLTVNMDMLEFGSLSIEVRVLCIIESIGLRYLVTMEANAFFILLNVMWLFSLYRRVLYFWIAYSQVRANLYDNIFFSGHNSNTMYIYKRPYVHFPTIFLRQNCDHMCIIKIVFNPLPMKIFWKKTCCVYSVSER